MVNIFSNTASFATALGLIGVAITLWAYFELQIGRLSNNALRYSVVNIIGSILIIVSLAFHWNLPSFIIELSWIAISLMGIVRCCRGYNSTDQQMQATSPE